MLAPTMNILNNFHLQALVQNTRADAAPPREDDVNAEDFDAGQ